MKKDTVTLQAELNSASTLKEFLDENDTGFQEESIAELLESMIAQRKLKKTALAMDAGMSEVYLFQILSGSRRPSRNRLICLCVAMKAGLDETQELLKQSGQAILYPKSRRDAVIMYGIMHRQELHEINDALYESGENTLV